MLPELLTWLIGQFWRILIHPLAFANSTELLVAEVLLYHVGVHIERYVNTYVLDFDTHTLDRSGLANTR